MKTLPDTINWTETLRMRWSALGTQYWRYLINSLARWTFWCGTIVGLALWSLAGKPLHLNGLWYFGAAATVGIVLRLLLHEPMPRWVRIDQSGLSISGPTRRRWRIDEMRVVSQTPLDDQVDRIEFSVPRRFGGGRQIIVVGAPRGDSDLLRRYLKRGRRGGANGVTSH